MSTRHLVEMYQADGFFIQRDVLFLSQFLTTRGAEKITELCNTVLLFPWRKTVISIINKFEIIREKVNNEKHEKRN